MSKQREEKANFIIRWMEKQEDDDEEENEWSANFI